MAKTADNDRSFDQQSLANEASSAADSYASAQTAEAAETEDLPQELTESYGTGVHESNSPIGRDRALDQASAELAGGDVDVSYEEANAVGDEAVGGTAPTPDMDVVDELGKAVGLNLKDEHALRTNDLLEQRDNSRWELEPDSSEDYSDRQAEPNIDL